MFETEWNKDPNKELKKKVKDGKVKGTSAQHLPVLDGQQSSRPNVPPVCDHISLGDAYYS
jgi:hypothetical protein